MGNKITDCCLYCSGSLRGLPEEWLAQGVSLFWIQDIYLITFVFWEQFYPLPGYQYSNVFLYFYVFLIIIPCFPSIFFYFFFHPSLVSINSSYPWKYFLNAIRVANLVIIALTFVGNVCDCRSWGILLLYTGAKWIELILAWKSPKV